MSRLKITSGKEVEFEKACKSNKKNTDGVKGFRKIYLIKGNVSKDFSLYIFHSEWNSENDFTNWIKSDSFKFAHKNPTAKKNLYLGPPNFDGYDELPEFEGFKVII